MSATAAPTTIGELRPIVELVRSPLNPRKQIDQGKLEELAASITAKGILEPLIVRPRAGFGQLEIICGERRYRAAKHVKLQHVPVIIRPLSDVEALEVMAIENSQRDDLHPLEESDGYLALMKADRAYTAKAIAAKIGKSERYVQQRLQLARLEPDIKKSFLENHITAGHADLMSRLAADDQKAALKACFHNLYGDDKERGCISVRQLNTWIEHSVRLRLTKDDPQTTMFPELAKMLEKSENPTGTLVEIAGSYIPDTESKKLGVVNTTAYRRIHNAKDKCKHARRAFVAIGEGRGRIIEICTAKTECKTHWRWEIEETERRSKAAKTAPGSKAKAKHDNAAEQARRKANDAERRRREQSARWHTAKARALDVLKKQTVKPALALEVLAMSGRGDGKSWTSVVVECLEDDLFLNSAQDWKKAVAQFKKFGIKLDAIAQALADQEAQTSAAKGTKKATKRAA